MNRLISTFRYLRSVAALRPHKPRNARGGRRHGGEHGFALLELLVALVVLALGLGAISTGIALSVRSDRHTQSSRTALRLAQTRLEAAGVDEALIPGRHDGRFANGFRWRETVTAVSPVEDSKPQQDSGPERTPVASTVVAYWVEVEVQALDRNVAHLAALKLFSDTQR